MGTYSTINGVEVAEDNNFSPQPSIIRAAEMTNGYGQAIGDFVRTRYALAYKWDELPQDILDSLIDATDPTAYSDFSVTHSVIGGTYTGTYRVTSMLTAEKLEYSEYLGRNVWVNVTLKLEEV